MSCAHQFRTGCYAVADDGIICFLFSYYLKLRGIVVLIKGVFRQILVGSTIQPPRPDSSLLHLSVPIPPNNSGVSRLSRMLKFQNKYVWLGIICVFRTDRLSVGGWVH